MTDKPEISLIESSDKRQHFTDVRHVTVRWEPYKPDGRRQMKAKGRWQEQVGSGDYWRWQNCDRPAFAHDVEVINAELLEALGEIADGYGPNHLSKFARDKARAAIAKAKGGDA